MRPASRTEEAAARVIEKIVDLDTIVRQRPGWRAAGRRVVLTNGAFDLLHVGHVRYLQAARARGDLLIVAVNDDASVRGYKGAGRPLVPAAERAELLAALACVDYVVLFGDATATCLVAAIQPDVYVKGGDYTRGELPEAPIVEALGGEVRILPYLLHHSTTATIERIRELAGAAE
jgi:rfaE bifunctional protein nucleotidyltransferase chain/domain